MHRLITTGQRSVRYIHLESAALMTQRTIECNYPHVLRVYILETRYLHTVRPPPVGDVLRTVPRDIETIKRTQGEQIGCSRLQRRRCRIGVPRCLCLRRPTCVLRT